jgi:capsular exopolysaccharide synthesis family protein
LRAIRGWLPLLIVGILVAAVPAYLIASRQEPAYDASASLLPDRLLPAAAPDYNQISLDRFVGLASTWSIVALTPEVLDPVIEQLGLTDTTATDLAKRIQAVADGNSALLTITAHAGTATGAADLANAVAAQVAANSSPEAGNDPEDLAQLENLSQRILDTQRDYELLLNQPPPISEEDQAALTNTLALLDSLNSSYEALATGIRQAPEGLTVVDPAVAAAATQTAPRALYYTALAAVIGLVVAAGIVWLLRYFDDRVKTGDDVRMATGLLTLGAVPKRGLVRNRAGGLLPVLRAPGSSRADEFRTIRAAIDMQVGQVPVRSMLIVGPSTGRDRAATVANLALAYAGVRPRVVLIDADLRSPSLHRLFGQPNDQGLTTLLAEPDLPAGKVARRVEGVDNLMLVTAGPSPTDPAAAMGSDAMGRLLARLTDDGTLVILNCAPLRVAVDGAVLSARVGATVLAVDAAHDGRRAVVEACEALDRAGAEMVGAVLISSRDGSFYAYTERSNAATVAEGPPADTQVPLKRARPLEHADT